MKKKVFFTVLMAVALHFNAQTVIFEETFESAVAPTLPAGWVSVDRDNDGISWATEDDASNTDPLGFSGKIAGVASQSSSSDNLLVSPAVNLTSGNPYSLKFLIGTITTNEDTPPSNHYAVYILPAAATFAGTETPVLEETISIGDTALVRTVNLSNFAGQNIKVYFRQFNSSNSLSVLFLDTVKVTQQSILGTSETVLSSAIGIYPNPTSDFIYLKSKSKIISTEIYDNAGRMMNAQLSDNKIDVHSLPPGVYSVIIKTTDKNYSQKFIKK